MSTSTRADLWRELIEIRNVIKEIAIRHNIDAHEEDEAHVILNEMKLGEYVEETSFELPISLQQLEKSEDKMNIFQKIDNEEIQKVTTKELFRESMKTAKDMIEVKIDISDETLLFLALEAHKNEMTLSQYIAKILETQIRNFQNKAKK